MSKYSNELKLKVIKYCIDEHHAYRDAEKQFRINHEQIRKWIKKYQEHGVSGLLKNPKSSYSGEFKQTVVEYMHENHLSFSETAIHFNLAGSDRVAKWERIYYEEGPQRLFEERRGINKNMSLNSKKKKLSKKAEEDLVVENERLRMENEYLKKLNALVQERIKRENKRK